MRLARCTACRACCGRTPLFYVLELRLTTERPSCSALNASCGIPRWFVHGLPCATHRPPHRPHLPCSPLFRVPRTAVHQQRPSRLLCAPEAARPGRAEVSAGPAAAPGRAAPAVCGGEQVRAATQQHTRQPFGMLLGTCFVVMVIIAQITALHHCVSVQGVTQTVFSTAVSTTNPFVEGNEYEVSSPACTARTANCLAVSVFPDYRHLEFMHSTNTRLPSSWLCSTRSAAGRRCGSCKMP